MGFSLLIAILFVGTTAFWLSQSLERQFETQYQSLTEMFAEQAFLAVIARSAFGGDSDFDPAAVERVVESLVGGDIIYAQIVKDGETVAENSKVNLTLDAAPVAVDMTMTRRQLEDGLMYMEFSRGLLGRSGEATSYIRLGVSRQPLQAALQNQLWTLGWIGLAITGVGALLGLGLFRGLWLPIRKLIEAVKQFGKGDYATTAPVEREDELGLLAKEFNQMAVRISEKNHELEQLNVELQKANRTKTEFLTIMSHELRTPLNAILGYAELLHEGKFGPLNEDQDRPLRRLLRAGEHLLSLIENTLNFAKLELGVEKLHLIEVDGETIIRECIEQLQPLAEERKIQIHLDVESVLLQADPMKLKQILLNLIQNAIQYTQETSVYVSSGQGESTICFKVHNPGQGMSADELDEMFQPFTRGKDAPRRSQSGVGLGLTVVERYTKMHGGSVSVDSQPGKGTTFIVTLPKQPQGGTLHELK